MSTVQARVRREDLATLKREAEAEDLARARITPAIAIAALLAALKDPALRAAIVGIILNEADVAAGELAQARAEGHAATTRTRKARAVALGTRYEGGRRSTLPVK